MSFACSPRSERTPRVYIWKLICKTGYINCPDVRKRCLLPTAPEQKFALQLNRTIVLVGLMGAGKTSVGKRLAAFLDVTFADSDHEVEAAAGMSISDIFAQFGEAHFRDGERKVISRLLTSDPCVLATGGGAFLSDQVRDDVSRLGVSVWLDADLDTLWDRVKDRDTRPLLKRDNPRQVLSDLLDARAPVYARAAIRVPSDPDISHEVMVRRILEAIRADDLAHPSRPATLTMRPAS